MNWSSKAKAARSLLIATGVNPKDISDRYGADCFLDGFPKIKVISQVLSGSPSEEVRSYLNERLSGEQFNFMRGGRPPFEYGSELVVGWILEDCAAKLLENSGIGVRMAGCDSGREFLPSRKVKTDADAELVVGSKRRNVELLFDLGLGWRRRGSAELRGYKLLKIQRQKSLAFGISALDATAFVYCPLTSSQMQIKHIPLHVPWNKSAYSILGVDDNLAPISDVVSTIKRMVLATPSEEAAA